MEAITNTFQAILTILNDVPPATWDLAIELIISGIAVSPIALSVKKWWQVDSEKKMISFVVVSSVIAALGVYLRNVPEFHPIFIMVEATIVFFTSQQTYFFFVKPLVRRIGAWMTENIKELNEDEAKTAIEPATSPVRGTQIDDFIVR